MNYDSIKLRVSIIFFRRVTRDDPGYRTNVFEVACRDKAEASDHIRGILGQAAEVFFTAFSASSSCAAVDIVIEKLRLLLPVPDTSLRNTFKCRMARSLRTISSPNLSGFGSPRASISIALKIIRIRFLCVIFMRGSVLTSAIFL